MKKEITIINNAFNAHQFDDVITLSKKLLKKIPNNDYLFNLIGLSFQQKTNLDEAEIYFKKALKVNPGNDSATNNLANNYKRQKKYSEAETLYKKVISKNPKYLSALNNYANLKKSLNQYDEAIILYKKALEINPEIIPTNYNIAIAYQSIGKFEEAINHANKIIKIDPNFNHAYKIISDSLDYSKNGDEHVVLMENRIKNTEGDSQKIPLYFSLAKAYEKKKNLERLFKILRRETMLKKVW